MMRRFMICCLLLATSLVACKTENKMSKIPSIMFLTLSPDVITAGEAQDTSWIAFSFEDGDGNIDTRGTKINIFIRDMRPSVNTNYKYGFPYIPDGFKDPAYGFKGVCRIGMPAIFFNTRDTLVHRFNDTTTFEVYIMDDDSNFSNKVVTAPLYIKK